jgi:hypothetical protein
MEVSPRNIRFNRFAILLQTRLPQSRRLTGCIASAIDALHYTQSALLSSLLVTRFSALNSIVISALFTNRTVPNS